MVKRNGQLVYVSDEEAKSIQQLSEEQQMPAQPVTPVGAGGVGATQDQAKMAGSKAQKQQALRVDVDPEKTLTYQDRMQQSREIATQAEQSAKEKAEKLRTLGSLESRVDDIIQRQFAQGYQGDQAALQFEAESPELQAALDAYSTALNAGDQQSINEAIVAVQQATGGELQTAQDISQYMLDKDEATGRQIAGQILDPDQVTLGTLDPTELGLTPEDLTGLLGPEWAGMSLEQLRETAADMQRSELSRFQDLKRELRRDITPARRKEIRRELRDLSQLGIAGAEMGVEDIEQQIEAAETVEWMGEERELKDILDDEEITKQITKYLALGEDDTEAKEQMEEQFGEEFTSWIQAHSAALEPLVGGAEEAQQAFTELQESNREALDVPGVGRVSDKLVADLFGLEDADAVGEWSAIDYKAELQQQPWYQVLRESDDPTLEKAEFMSALNEVDLDPEFAEELKQLDSAEVKKLMRNPKELRI
jgi:hypothetical protein